MHEKLKDFLCSNTIVNILNKNLQLSWTINLTNKKLKNFCNLIFLINCIIYFKSLKRSLTAKTLIFKYRNRLFINSQNFNLGSSFDTVFQKNKPIKNLKLLNFIIFNHSWYFGTIILVIKPSKLPFLKDAIFERI